MTTRTAKGATGLFNRALLGEFLKNSPFEKPSDYSAKREKIQDWAKGPSGTESNLEPDFLADIFRDVLGYSTIKGDRNMLPKERTDDKKNVPDATLGYFPDKGEAIKLAILELKGPDVELDKKGSGRGQTAVDQAFGYVSKNPGVKWVILTNLREIRLYKSDNQYEYERFALESLNKEKDKDESEFDRFYFLLCREGLICKDGESPVEDLFNRSRQKRVEISNQFYGLYKTLRGNLFRALKSIRDKNGGQITDGGLFSSAQKILDRFLFICFCQARMLLPPDTFKNALLEAKITRRRKTECRTWEVFKDLFYAIDKGDPPSQINGYNGGLFREDPVLDSLKIPDEELLPFAKLLDYDYNSDLNVNILGHIFEQSISDIERLKAGLQEAQGKNNRGKRKADGIFYTPNYITHYIVKNTIGAWLEAKREGIFHGLPELGENDAPKPKKGGGFTYTQANRRHLMAWEEYRKELLGLSVLDPACGSGAFLTEAFANLLGEGDRIDDEYKKQNGFARAILDDGTDSETEKGRLNYATWKTGILPSAIFGADKNAESVEITKLSLWLNSAEPDEQLQDLDGNIKVGDSIIADQSITKDWPALDWRGEGGFPQVMSKGGFDVVIGNPPYVNIDVFGHGSPVFGYLQNNYSEIYMDKSDLLFYFIKRAIDLLKPNGFLGFIVSNAFLFSAKAVKLRNYILDTCSVLEIVNFERHMVFRDAGITTCILILQKNRDTQITKVCNFKEDEYTEEAILGALNDRASYYGVELSKDSPFALVDERAAQLNSKIDGGHKKLGEICVLGQGMQTAADDIYSFEKFPTQFPKQFLKKRISGNNIERYCIDDSTENVLYLENIETFEELPEPIQRHLLVHKDVLSNRADKKRRKTAKWWNYTYSIHKEFYHLPKLICSRRAFGNIFVLANDFEYICFSNMTLIFCTNEAYRPEFLLALLNSKLLNYRYKSIGKQTGGGSFEYFPNGVEKLPIAEASQTQQESLAAKAKKMMELNKKLREGIPTALDIIKAEYGIKQIGDSLEKFYLLDAQKYLEELKNARANILEHEGTRLEWFQKTKEAINAIKQEIQELDEAIDIEVYALYGLTAGDIDIVEGRA